MKKSKQAAVQARTHLQTVVGEIVAITAAQILKQRKVAQKRTRNLAKLRSTLIRSKTSTLRIFLRFKRQITLQSRRMKSLRSSRPPHNSSSQRTKLTRRNKVSKKRRKGILGSKN